MEKVLVTGANGLLGSNIVRQLSAKGYLVKAMVRKGSDMLSLEGGKFELFEGEITDPGHVSIAVMGCDYVVHAAARTSQFPSNLEAFTKANIDATHNLIEACKEYKVKRFVFVSTANCFTNGSIENPGNESSGFMDWLKGSGYAYSKYLAQMEVLRQAMENAFPAIVVNPTFIIGPYDAKPSSGKLILYACKNYIVFYPPGGKNFVDAEHVAKAISNALKKGKLGESYLLAGKNLTYKDFFCVVKKYTGRRNILIPIPIILLSTMGKLSSLIEHYFPVSLPLNSVNVKLLCLENYFSNNKAKTELKLEETEINNAVSNAIDWFKQNKYL
jgi:dihydroflavonol-4-reductase